MSVAVPSSRPKMTEDAARAKLLEMGVDSSHKIAILGVRGYYADTIGEPNKNDRNVYDDALFVVTENAYASFNANTDPSVRRKNVAVLIPGVYTYIKGNHGISRPGGGYPALRQHGPVNVWRDGNGSKVFRGSGFAINIHKGSRNTTSSLGCQTIHPSQWDAFISLVYSEMRRLGTNKVTYVLVHGENA